MQKNHLKTLFFSKNLLGKKTKKKRKGKKKGGALIRAGAHIRDNTVIQDRLSFFIVIDLRDSIDERDGILFLTIDNNKYGDRDKWRV